MVYIGVPAKMVDGDADVMVVVVVYFCCKMLRCGGTDISNLMLLLKYHFEAERGEITPEVILKILFRLSIPPKAGHLQTRFLHSHISYKRMETKYNIFTFY